MEYSAPRPKLQSAAHQFNYWLSDNSLARLFPKEIEKGRATLVEKPCSLDWLPSDEIGLIWAVDLRNDALAIAPIAICTVSSTFTHTLCSIVFYIANCIAPLSSYISTPAWQHRLECSIHAATVLQQLIAVDTAQVLSRQQSVVNRPSCNCGARTEETLVDGGGCGAGVSGG